MPALGTRLRSARVVRVIRTMPGFPLPLRTMLDRGTTDVEVGMAFIERNVRAGPLGVALAGRPLAPGGYLVVWRGEERFLARTLRQGISGEPVVQVVQPGWPGASSNEAIELGLHEIDLIEMDWATGGDLDKAVALSRAWDRRSGIGT